MKLIGHGRLQHRFWLDYSASIVIVFDSPESCSLALPKLQVPGADFRWKPGVKHPSGACVAVNSDQLSVLEAHLGTLGANTKAISSVDHSIDFGDPFTVTVEVEDPKQVQMFV